MSDVYCLKCGEPWDYWGAQHGEMKAWEWDLFRKGAGCPSCEGRRDPNWEPNKLEHFELGDLDPAERFEEPTAKWGPPPNKVVWSCSECGLELAIPLSESVYDGSKRVDEPYVYQTGSFSGMRRDDIPKICPQCALQKTEGLQGHTCHLESYGGCDVGWVQPSPGESVAYSAIGIGNTWFVSDHLTYSDYFGGVVCRANQQSFLERFEDHEKWLVELSGGHGTSAVAIHIELAPNEVWEVLAGLEDYPCLDDCVLSDLELEDEQEAWEFTYKCDFTKKLTETLKDEMTLPIEIQKLLEWEGEDGVLLEAFNYLTEYTNTDWEHSVEGPYISLDRLFNVEVEVLVDALLLALRKD